ncbi:ankyrin repeat protein [Megavirus baoshan]|uniref:Ankyrin repeat protein n=1 Tax=Megavirus baoshan TaxID=2496520 RepID=A0A3Q8U922_9VIRU|nr:ankyrin repeat protein [Megavirus baoshan]AZL90016.1 ankyrin repeat protein [Megavirus baoshan]
MNKINNDLTDIYNEIDSCREYINQPNTKGQTILMLACINPNISLSAINLLIKMGANINSKTTCNETILMLICKSKNPNPEIVKLLLDNGIDINAVDNHKRTALIIASLNAKSTGNLKIIELLLDHGADINHFDKHNHTPLMYASKCANGSSCINAVKLLIKKGANINAYKNNGMTALKLSVRYTDTTSSLRVIKLLVKNGAGVNILANNCNHSILMRIIKNYEKSNYDTFVYLIKKGANIHHYNNGWNILMFACRYINPDSVKIIKLLLKKGIDINNQSKLGTTCLSLAFQYANLNIINILLKKGADAKFITKNKKNALMLLCDNYCYEEYKKLKKIINILLDSGININSQDNLGDTALMILAKNNSSIKLLKLLLDYGSDVYITNKKGKNIWQLMKKKYICDVIKHINIRQYVDICHKKILTSIKYQQRKILWNPEGIRHQLISLNHSLNYCEIESIIQWNKFELFEYLGINDTSDLIVKVRDNIKYIMSDE